MALIHQWFRSIALISMASISARANAQVAVQREVRAARASYNAAIARRDTAAIRRVMTPTYHLVAGRSTTAHGADAMVNRWATSFAGDSAYGCVRTPTNIMGNATWGLAHEVGHWRCSFSGERAKGAALGTYDARWQRDISNRWRVDAELFTTESCGGSPKSCQTPDPVPASTVSTGPVPPSSNAIGAVRAARALYNRAMGRGDADFVVAMFTPDYHAIFGFGQHTEGTVAALVDWKDFLKTRPEDCMRTTDSVAPNDAWGMGHERGHWVCTTKRNGSQAKTSGVYVTKWLRDVSGRWRAQSEEYTALQCTGAQTMCSAPKPLAAYTAR